MQAPGPEVTRTTSFYRGLLPPTQGWGEDRKSPDVRAWLMTHDSWRTPTRGNGKEPPTLALLLRRNKPGDKVRKQLEMCPELWTARDVSRAMDS